MSRLPTSPDSLFTYGTLRVDRVINGLLGRVPASASDTARGWRAASLRNRVYPGLVPAPGESVQGRLYTDLSAEEWNVLDRFEDDLYVLRRLRLDSGRQGWAYVWDAEEVLARNWSVEEFEAEHLDAYVSRFSSPSFRDARRGA
ncbi:gamma-glutamylcyclotransferase family protein [Streptomyces sp. 4N509B]|uniref:gamma-glutamylcyclotransferase family protein n=1 Tax=Streptomyces sp. 4N509B TaxID=3457413 RepID=UPI003FD33F69